MRTARFLEEEREDRNVPDGIRAEEEEKDENGVALVQRVKERTGSFDIYLFNCLYFEREKNEKIKSQLWTSIASMPCLRIFYYYYYYLRKRISSFCSFLFF